MKVIRRLSCAQPVWSPASDSAVAASRLRSAEFCQPWVRFHRRGWILSLFHGGVCAAILTF
jgi:hypothetical protein